MICESTVKKYCCDNISKILHYENAIADKKETWDCHHKLETHTSEGFLRSVPLTKEELKALEVYYNRPAEELIFLKQDVHKYIHQAGKPMSEDLRKKISIANRNNVSTRCNAEMRRKLSEIAKARNTKYFLGKHHTEESKKLLSKSHKGICKGKKWYNNGTVEKMDFTCPLGYTEGRLFHARSK